MSTSAHSQVPFPPSYALNTEQLTPHSNSQSQNSPSTCPSKDKGGYITYVPGEPAVNLLTAEVNAYLSKQLDTPLLDELYDRLWLVARKSGQSVDALHMQRVKGWSVVPTEDPRLHLIWHHDKIYIKPVPVCLLNHDFWAMYLRLPESKKTCSTSSHEICQSVTLNFGRPIAVGFLRSYAFLVQHRLDLILAKEFHLIPDDVDWIKWSKFINKFRHLGDELVAKRFHYGQLRLSRLNWAVRIFRPQHASTVWFYEIPHWSIAAYLTRATIPLLFMFASLSLVLSAMQVVLSAPADGLRFQRLDDSGLRDMRRAFWVFSIGILLLSGVLWVLFLGIPLIVLAWQLSWGFKKQESKGATCISSV